MWFLVSVLYNPDRGALGRWSPAFLHRPIAQCPPPRFSFEGIGETVNGRKRASHGPFIHQKGPLFPLLERRRSIDVVRDTA